MWIHEQLWISRQVHMKKCEYQPGNTWASVNINTGIQDPLRIATGWSMTKWIYQQKDTWPSNNIKQGVTRPSVNINLGTNGHMWRATLISDQMWISKRKIWPSVNINMVIHDQVIIVTWGSMNKCTYQHKGIWPSHNVNSEIHDQVWISTLQ